MLQVRGVHKAYGAVEALRGVDLEVAPGEIVGLVGPNGAGKTSLVSIIAGLRRPDRGDVHVGGLDVTKHRQEVGRLLGLAPQELAIYPAIKVRDNLVLYAELAGLRGAELRRRIDETAEALGITDLLGRRGAALSGGQKRRLHTAMALVHRPPLLLLDEPTVGADIESRQQLLDLVRSLADDGAAVCYSTHYLPEVEVLGATVAVLEAGRVIVRGTLPELLAAHAQPAVELEFHGPAPAHLAGGDGVVDGHRLRLPSSDPAATAAAVLTRLGSDDPPLAGLEIVHPTLEAVYLNVTGRRFDVDVRHPKEQPMSPLRSAALVRHEFRVMLADSASLLSLTLMPLVMMAFFKPLARLALAQDDPTANGSEYTVPAMTTMFAFFLVGFVGFAFFSEHQWNTWERLRASPASNAEILVGKIVPAVGLCLVQQAVLFGAGFALFGLRVRGSVLGVLLLCLALSACLVSIGVLLAAVLKTQQQLNAISNVGAMVLAGVSGALVPLSILPGWAQSVAPIAPQYWAMRGFRATILEGQGVGAVALPVGVLLAIGLLAGGLALMRFRFDEPKVLSN